MAKPKTHFEEVPLEVVKKVVEKNQAGTKARMGPNDKDSPGIQLKGKTMSVPFDIFLTETNGGVLWIGTAETVEDAQARVRELASRSPGEYFLLNQKTGNRLVIRLDGLSGAPGESQQKAQNAQ